MIGILVVGTILTLLTKDVLHRQNATYIDEKPQESNRLFSENISQIENAK